MNLSLVKVGGVCAILTVLSFIITGILVSMSGAGDVIPEVKGTVEWLQEVADDQTVFLAGGWFSVLAPVLAIVALLGIYQALREFTPLMLVAVVSTIVGLSLVIISHLIPVAMGYELAPGYVAANDASRPSLEVLAKVLAMISLLTNAVGNSLNSCIGILLFALAILRSASVPKWIGWLGLVAAVLEGWVGLLAPVSEVIEGVSTIGFIAAFVWLVAMGVTLLRLRESPTIR